MNKIIFLLFISMGFLYSQNIKLAISSNVYQPILEIVNMFNEKHPNINISITSLGSSKIASQIIYGAKYDIFLSANKKFADVLYDKKLTLNKPKIYTIGSLCAISYKYTISSIKDVLDKKIKTIAIANEKLAPYGLASKQALKSLQLYEKVKHKFIYTSSISQAFIYAKTSTDMAFVAKSFLAIQDKNKCIKIDNNLHLPIKQYGVMLNNAKNKKYVFKFYNFLFSKYAQEIFLKYGYLKI